MVPDFSQRTIDTLSRRSALRCSNPDCDKLTSGPNSEPLKSTSIGEAAHIFGAKAGAARFRPLMSDVERSAISNAIWLCRDCHGVVDKDERRFPSDLLFLWKEKHEAKIMLEFGKPGDLMRFSLLGKEMDEFAHLPPFIRQIIRDRSDNWEYLLTVEMLDHLLAPHLQKADYLRNGLWSSPIKRLPPEQFPLWLSDKIAETTKCVDVLKNVLKEMMISWGNPGEPGDLNRIIRTCELYARCASCLVESAEETMFTSLPDGFGGVTRIFSEGMLHVLARFPEVPKFIRSILAGPEPKGVYDYVLVLDLPEGWAEEISRAFEIGRAALEERGGRW